jgi:hypothetical protein
MTTTPRLRTDLMSAQVEEADGVLCFDISDPKSGGVLRLFDFEWQLAQRFDGQRSLDELSRWTEEQLGFAASREDLQVYAERLQQLGLVEGTAPAGRPLPGSLMASAVLRAAGLLPSEPAPAKPAEPAQVAKGPEKPVEKPVEKAPEKPVEKAPEKPTPVAVKPVEKAPERPADKPPERAFEPPRRPIRDEDEPAMGRPVLAARLAPPTAKPVEASKPVEPVVPPKPVEVTPPAEVKPVEPVTPSRPVLPVPDAVSQPESLRSVLEALPPPSEEPPVEVKPVERPSGVAAQPEKAAIAEALSGALSGSPTMPLEPVSTKPPETPASTTPVVPVEVQVPARPTKPEETKPAAAQPTQPRASERPTTPIKPVPAEKPSNAALWVVVVILLLAALAAGYWFLLRPTPAAPPVGVRVNSVQPADVPRTFPSPALVKAAEPQPLKISAAGKVAKVVAEGATVLPDEVLVQLEAPVKLAKSLDLARKNLEAWKKKLEASRGKPKLERDAQAKVADYEKALAQLGEQQKAIQLTAPRAGTVNKVLIKVHDAVTPGTDAVLFSDKGLAAELKVPAIEAQGLKAGQDAQLLGAAGPVAVKVASVASEGDLTTLRFALPEGAAVKEGDELKLARAPLSQVVRLPASALVDGSKVFVVQGGVASVRAVTVADRDGTDALVQGLPAGTQVIVSPVNELREGVAVQPQ